MLLGEKGSSGGAGRELALDTGEDALDQGAASVLPTREVAAHLGSHPSEAPSALSSLGGDDALSMQLLPVVEMISFTVEFGIGQHLTDVRVAACGSDQRGQEGAVVRRAPAGGLCQQELLIDIDDHQPLQPVPPGKRFLRVMMHPTDKERAEGPAAQTSRIHRHASTPTTGPASTAEAASPKASSIVPDSSRRRKRYNVV